MDGRQIGTSGGAVRLCLSALVMLATLAGLRLPDATAATTPAWPKARFDTANTAFNPAESWLSTGNVASLAPDWTTRIADRESLLVSGGVIYTGCERESYCALDATNGSIRWKTPVGVAVPPRSAALVGGLVYVNGSVFFGNMYSPLLLALDAGTGAVVWRTMIMNGCCNGSSTALVVADGLVVQRWGDALLAWDASTGIQRWIVRVPAGGLPAIVGGVVYAQADGPKPTLYALRATTGETLWTSKPVTGTSGAPVVTGGLVIVAGDQTAAAGRLSAYRTAGCATSPCPPVWSTDLAPAPSAGAAVAGGVLYQGLADGSYAAVDVESGRLLWKATPGVTGPSVDMAPGAPTVANGLLFGQAGGSLRIWASAGCATATCPPLWSAPLGGTTWTAGDIVVTDGRVYVANYLAAHGWEPAAADLLVFSPRLSPPPTLIVPPVVPVVPKPPRTVPTTLRVPQDHLGIQRAIDASIPGDVVVVAPGVYHERLDFHGHSVEVRSTGGPDVTTIDGDGLSTVVAFQSNETRAAVLRGFTVRNGVSSPWGGGVRVTRSSPTIVGNVITGNKGHNGSGILVDGGAPAIVDNQLRDNHMVTGEGAFGGGALDIDADSGAEVRGNLIEDNSAAIGGGLYAATPGSMTIADNVVRRNTAEAAGGGVYLGDGGEILFTQNVVVENSAGASGGGMVVMGRPTLLANTIAANSSPRASGVDASDAFGALIAKGNVISGPPGASVVECEKHLDWVLPSFRENLVHSGDVRPVVVCENDSLSDDPRFVSPTTGDYRLGRGSPAIDAGGPTSPRLTATDARGAPRVVDGNGDGVAVIDMGAYEGQLPLPEVGDGFRPVTPARLLDTRNGLGAPAGKVGPKATLDLQVTGRGGVPATGVSSVVLNVTVTEPTATSFLTAWPAGLVRPVASNLNFVTGQTVPNLVTVRVGSGGKVSLFNNAGSAHVIVDVAGWYGDVDGSRYTPLEPSRILDTRGDAPLGAASTLSVQVTGRGGVPASGVSAVVMNVTVTEPTATSFLTAWPAGVARPTASNLNPVAGETVPNLVVVKVGDGGKVNIYNNSGTTHVVADIAGWFGDGPEASGFVSLPPARILDTRTTTTEPGPASVLNLQVTGRGGVPASGVAAVVLNITVTEPTSTSYLTAWPAGVARPLASNLNYVAGQTVPNLVVAKVGQDGRASLYNNAGWAHVVVDVAGWYAA